jgi:hypothetical protein
VDTLPNFGGQQISQTNGDYLIVANRINSFHIPESSGLDPQILLIPHVSSQKSGHVNQATTIVGSGWNFFGKILQALEVLCHDLAQYLAV